MLAQKEYLPIPSEYLPKLPIELKIRLLYRGTTPETRYNINELAKHFGVTTMGIREALKDISNRGITILVEERSGLGRGMPQKFYWIEPT
jgi:predicted ArsR family transcriptional regulator